MKKVTIFLIVCISAFIISCNDDDKTNNTHLVGSWTLTSINHASTTRIGETIISTTTGVGRDISYTETYTEKPNEVTTNGGFILDLTTVENGESTNHSIGTTGTFTSNWSLDGNSLTISWNTGSQVNSITTLDENKFSYTINRTEEQNQDGILQTTTIEETYIFTR